MAIPQSIRDQIGTADMAPVWRLIARTSYTDPGVDVTDQMLTDQGPALAARADLTTAPTHELTVTSTTPGPFTGADPDGVQYVLEVGYRDTTGAAHYEPIGAYYFNTQEHSEAQTVTHLVSAEIQAMGKLEPRGSSGPIGGAAFQAMQAESEVLRFGIFVGGVLDEVLPAAFPHQLPPSSTFTTWSPTSEDDFMTAKGTDAWDAITALAVTARMRVYPLPSGAGWWASPSERTTGTNTATIPRAQCTEYTETWAPRNRLEKMFVRFTETYPDGETIRTRYDIADSTHDYLARADIVSYPTPLMTSQAPLARAWGRSRQEALNTLEYQHTFTIPARPWIRPENTITITDPTGDRTLLVSTINTDPIAGTQTITAREIL